VLLALAVLLTARCGAMEEVARGRVEAASGALFADDFESGTLEGWQDGVDPLRHRIVTDPAAAHSGRRYLSVTYPAGQDGGWLTHWMKPGLDSLYVSYYVRFPPGWQGSTKLVALYGSREDDPWSALGKAGTCPDGHDFFAAMVVTEAIGDPGPLRFYTYHPDMAREPDGTTCWGRFAGEDTQYGPATALSLGQWHHVEFQVALNTPGQKDGRQTFWVDGTEGGRWIGLRFRDDPVLRLNAVQLTMSRGAGPTEELAIDDLVVRPARP
jgi:hypothetical protein